MSKSNKIKTNEIKKIIKRVAASKNRRSQNPNTVSHNKLEMLITVVGRSKAEYYIDLIQSFDVNLQVMALAEGTADAKTMRYLGLTDNGKSVIFSIIQEDRIADAMHTLGEKFATLKGGKGIAFTVPLTSVIGKLLFGFLSNNKSVVREVK